MRNVVDYLLAQGVIQEGDGQCQLRADIDSITIGIPETLRQFIEEQIGRLAVDVQQVLEVASVMGIEFSATAVAAGLQVEAEVVDRHCETLTRAGLFIQSRGIEEWPDGTIGGRYRFLHAFYQQVLYEHTAEVRRVRLHRRMGELKEAAYGERAHEVAGELAAHFVAGRDLPRAIQFLRHAGENAVRRHAHHEAIGHLTHGLELLRSLPDTPDRARQEFTLQRMLGASLFATKGFAAPEVGNAYQRAWELRRQVGDDLQLFSVINGLWVFHLNRAELQTSGELANQLLQFASTQNDPALLMAAHQSCGLSLFYQGELAAALHHLEQGIALYDVKQPPSPAFLYGQDHGVMCLSYAAWVLTLLGYPDQALQRSTEALQLATQIGHPFSHALALHFAALVDHHRGEARAAQEKAEALITLSGDHGFTFYVTHGELLRGRALVEQRREEEGITLLRQGLSALQASGAAVRQSYYLASLAAASASQRQIDQGLTFLDKALGVSQAASERYYEAELYRLKGELTPQKGARGWGPGAGASSRQAPSSKPLVPTEVGQEAEGYFLKAIGIAGRQGAKSLELRAAISLGRLWRQQNKGNDARQLLAAIYGWFTEGFDTADLRAAKALLDELASSAPRTSRRPTKPARTTAARRKSR
jgi:predicted ATPase